MADIDGATSWTSPAGTTMTAKFLAPVPNNRAGPIDQREAFAIESRLDEETTRRLREISIDDTPIDSERTADQVLDDLIGWFEGRRLAARERELKRRMRDPGEDHEALLAERHALLLERRARMGVGRESTVPGRRSQPALPRCSCGRPLRRWQPCVRGRPWPCWRSPS